jgi:hypothetical protein
MSDRDEEVAAWIAYADKLEAALELVCGQSRDELTKMHAEQGLRLRLVRPNHQSAPLCLSPLPSGEGDPSVMLDCGGADTSLT